MRIIWKNIGHEKRRMIHSIVLNMPFFPNILSQNNTRSLPTTTQLLLDSLKRGDNSQYITEKLLADIPGHRHPKNIPTERYLLADPPARIKTYPGLQLPKTME
jgi:hypothetical protein